MYDAVRRRLIDALARTGQTIPMDIARRINRTARSLLTDAEQPLSRGELLEWARDAQPDDQRADAAGVAPPTGGVVHPPVSYGSQESFAGSVF